MINKMSSRQTFVMVDSPRKHNKSRERSSYPSQGIINGRSRDWGNSYEFEETDRERVKSETTLFKLKLNTPPSTDPRQWRKFFATVETSLKRWYQQRNYSDANENTLDKWDIILPYVENLFLAATKLFLIDTQYYIENEIDTHVWKYGIYQFIAIFRGRLPTDDKYKVVTKMAYRDVFGGGINHFKDLLIKAPVALKIDLHPIFERTGFLRGSLRKEELTLEENLIYKLLIALGDLHRYAYEVNKLPNDAKMAGDMYNAARFCDTEKSRAYNQLGVLAKIQNDIIGTVYNYTRAWCAAVPADGARDQLFFAYDEIYKNYSAVRHQLWYPLSKLLENNLKPGSQSRIEIWLPPVSGKKKRNVILPPPFKIPLCKEQHINTLSDTEVFSKFSLAYAHFLGKLCTKIGTETLEEVAKEAVGYFEGLILQKNATKFSFLVEVVGLLLFMVDYLTPPEGKTDNVGMISQMNYMKDFTMRISLEMISIIIERTLRILKLLDWENPMLGTCSAALHTWCRWAKRRPFVWSGHMKYWKPLRSPTNGSKADKGMKVVCGEPCGRAFLRLESDLGVLFQRYSSIVFPKISIGRTNDCQTPLGIFPEQLVLDRFGEVLLPNDCDSSLLYYDGRFTQDRAFLHYRFSKIARFGRKVFSDRKSLVMAMNRNTSSPDSSRSSSSEDTNILNFIHESLLPPPKAFKIGRADCNNARIILRKAADEEGGRYFKPKFSKVGTTKVYEVWSNLCAMRIKTEFVIQPRRIVLDTNCFIQHLNWVEFLMKVSRHPLYVPTTVILELRGLTKGIKSPRIRGKQLTLDEIKEKMIHRMMIGEQCTRALDFLNEHRYHFAVVTVSGRRYKMYNFVKQKIFDDMMDASVRNDEKIMETCRQLEASDEKTRSKDVPLRLYGRTVLLTDDRSLRVRAFAADIPARQIQPLTKWLVSVRKGCGSCVAPE